MGRCFIRLPGERRTKIMVLPTDSAAAGFAEFKLKCLAKLGHSTASAEAIMLFLDSNRLDIDVDTAPEVEALDEISPDDFLIVQPPKDFVAYGGSTMEDCEGAKDGGTDDGEHRNGQATADTAEEEHVEEDDEDEDNEDNDDEEDEGAGGGKPTDGGKGAATSKRGRKRAAAEAASPRAKAQPKATVEAVLDEDLEAMHANAARGEGSSGGGEGAPSSSTYGSGGAGGDDPLAKVKQRIRKMLSLGLHPETGEAEAEASMRMAEKLLSKHTLRQADVLDEDHVPEALRGGKAVVHLRSTGRDQRPCQTKQWMHVLGNAVTRNFDCSYYFTSHAYPPKCDFTFYGIATNASLAAFAFAAAFNRIAILTAAHHVPPGEFEAKRAHGLLPASCSKGGYTTAARVCYMEGLTHGLLEAVKASKRRKELEQQRRLEMAKEMASRGEPWQSSDDDDDDDGGSSGDADDGDPESGGGGHGGGRVGDGYEGSGGASANGANGDETKVKVEMEEEEGDVNVKLEEGAHTSAGAESTDSHTADPSPPSGSSAAPGEVKKEMSAADAVVKLEREAKAATALVTHHENIAKTFLKEAGVKLSHRKRKYTASVSRHRSFEKGKVDSKEIDVNQKSLTGSSCHGKR